MKFFVVFSALLALCAAKPNLLAPVAYNAVPLIHNNRFSYSTYTADPYSATTSVVSSAPTFYNYVTPTTYSAPLTYAAPIAYSAPIAYNAPVTYAAPVARALLAEKSQYHSQDSLGQAAYGHSETFQSHNAIQDAHGNKVGSFSYVAPDGRVLATNYVADALGYRVTSNALPAVAPAIVASAPATAVVNDAPAAAQYDESVAPATSDNSDDDTTVVGSVPEETPEVAAARAAHIAAHEAVKSRSKRSALLAAPALAYSAPLAYTAPLTYSTYPYAYSSLALAKSSGHSTVINHGSPAYYYY